VSRLLSWREKQVSRRRSQRENGLADGAHGQRTGEQTELTDRERLADGAHGQRMGEQTALPEKETGEQTALPEGERTSARCSRRENG